MNEALEQRIAAMLSREVDPLVAEWARRLGQDAGALAVLFYGSNLRSGSLDGVLDYYVLTAGSPEKGLWPLVAYREWEQGELTLRAKIATVTLAKFAAAAAGETLDTTIWARFVQPSALVWQRDEASAAAVRAAVADAARTAARLAVVVGPREGRPDEFWRSLFGATYRAELRVEPPGRENAIVEANREHFDGLLGAALGSAGIAFAENGTIIRPSLTARERRRIGAWWRLRRRMGKPLNVLRLVRAAGTFDGAARYAAWKIERHTGVAVDVTPWREAHPVLSAPRVLWQIWRQRKLPR